MQIMMPGGGGGGMHPLHTTLIHACLCSNCNLKFRKKSSSLQNSQQGVGGVAAGAAAELRVGMVMGTTRAEMKRPRRVQSVEAERERGATVREFTGSEDGEDGNNAGGAL